MVLQWQREHRSALPQLKDVLPKIKKGRRKQRTGGGGYLIKPAQNLNQAFRAACDEASILRGAGRIAFVFQQRSQTGF